ncbi:MAG: hypothetical protein RLZZ127_3014 [Planctomycetota bacterium]|jgi:uncharacterized protein (DUF2062 family)
MPADPDPAPWPAGIAVLIPVYNHAATVGRVVAGCRALGAPLVLVVDDGSTDGSGAAAAGADAVLALARNQGKGRALAAGLAELHRRGFRQVLSIDADLQHPPGEGLRLAAAAAAEPAALWLGVRGMGDAGAPGANRFGRWFTSLWTWVACGCWPEDNQTGMRVYPLPAVLGLAVRARGYAFEVETLVRAVWAGIPVRRLAVAVVYHADRVTHFHKLRDNVRMSWMFTRLVTRRCLPWPHRRADGGGGWRGALAGGLGPGQTARAAALGAALGVAPIPGLQLLAATWLALVLRVNPVVAAVASNISFGPLLALWFALAAAIGHLLLTGDATGFAGRITGLPEAIHAHGAWEALRPLLGAWLAGTPVVMAAAAVLGGAAGWAAARLWARRRHG